MRSYIAHFEKSLLSSQAPVPVCISIDGPFRWLFPLTRAVRRARNYGKRRKWRFISIKPIIG